MKQPVVWIPPRDSHQHQWTFTPQVKTGAPPSAASHSTARRPTRSHACSFLCTHPARRGRARLQCSVECVACTHLYMLSRLLCSLHSPLHALMPALFCALTQHAGEGHGCTVLRPHILWRAGHQAADEETVRAKASEEIYLLARD